MSACSTQSPYSKSPFGWLKPGVARTSGILRVRGSWSMCWKIIPRRPLRGQRHKSQQFGFRSVMVGRTYSPVFRHRSFFALQAVCEWR